MRSKMVRSFLVLLVTLLGATLGQIQYGIPVQKGYFIPVNSTNNSAYSPPNNRQLYPPLPNPGNYQPQYPNQNIQPPPYGVRNLQPNYPVVPPASYSAPGSYVPPASYSAPGSYVPPVNHAANNTTNPNNSVVYGARRQGDTMLFKTIISKSLPIFGSTAIKELVIPDPSSKQRFNYISEIKITNNKQNGLKWGSEIQKGGVGKNYVQIRFKSKSALDLSLEIYGN